MKILRFATAFIITELAFILFFILFWSLNKGFEFTDESYYLLSVLQPEESSDTFYYQHLINKVTSCFKPGLVGFRLLRLILMLASALFLAFAVQKYYKSRPFKNVFSNLSFFILFSFLFVLLGVSYSIYPQAVSYNNLTVIGLSFLFSFFLLYITAVSQNSIKSVRIFAGFLGCVSVLIFFCRFTSGIFLFAFIPGILYVSNYKKEGGSEIIRKSLFSYILGSFLTFLISSIFVHSVLDFFAGMRDSIKYIPGHTLTDILSTYKNSFLFVLDELKGEFLIIPLLIVVYSNMQPRIDELKSFSRFLHISISLAIMTLLIYLIYDNNLIYSGIQYFNSAIIFYLILSACVIALVLNANFLKKLSNSGTTIKVPLLICFFLLFVPFIGSVGTDNALHIQFLQFMFGWMLLLAFIIYYSYDFINKPLAIGLIIIMTVGAFSQSVHGLVYGPYRITGSLFDQKFSKELKTGDKILVDLKTYNAITEFESKMSSVPNYQEGDPMIILMGMPGYIYLAQASVVKNAWTTASFPDALCFNLRASKRQDLSRTVIISPRTAKLSSQLVNCMKEHKILFPRNYLHTASFNDPIFNIGFDIHSPK